MVFVGSGGGTAESRAVRSRETSPGLEQPWEMSARERGFGQAVSDMDGVVVLQDRQRVDSTGDQATELAVLRRRPVDVKPLGTPVGGEVDEFGLGHRV